MKIGAIIQARMGSTRLPGKVMLEIAENTVLYHVIKRVQQSVRIDAIIIATTNDSCDDVIEKEAFKYNVEIFRGSEENVLERYYLAAKKNNLDVVVRITSDCPLIDPHIIDNLIEFFEKGNYKMVTNSGGDYQKRTIPQGMDVEVFSFASLEEAYFNADQLYQQEHVTPYIYENCQELFFQRDDQDYANLRLTLDTKEDYMLIKEIYSKLYDNKHDFYLPQILQLYADEPELFQVNKHIIQKKVK